MLLLFLMSCFYCFCCLYCLSMTTTFKHSVHSIILKFCFCPNLKFRLAAHRAVFFLLTFADAPFSFEPLLTPGCVVPPYPGLLTFNPFRVWTVFILNTVKSI